MQLSALLSATGHPPRQIQTNATLSMRKTDTGFKIFNMHLDTTATVDGIDNAAFQAAAEKAKTICPVSSLLAPGLEELTLYAKLG
jgi:osmotically inducible protein OsmC